MLWYNNPDAVSAIHRKVIGDRTSRAERHRLLRLVDAGDASGRR